MKNRSARRSTAHSVQIPSSPRPKSSASAALHWRTASLPTRWSWRCTVPVKSRDTKVWITRSAFCADGTMRAYIRSAKSPLSNRKPARLPCLPCLPPSVRHPHSRPTAPHSPLGSRTGLHACAVIAATRRNNLWHTIKNYSPPHGASWNASARLTPRSWKRAGVIFTHASRVSAQSTAS